MASRDTRILHDCYGVGGVGCYCCRPRARSGRGPRRRLARHRRLVSRLARHRAADAARRDTYD